MPRVYAKKPRKDRLAENLNIPMKTADLVRLNAEAAHRNLTRTELARRLIVSGLETLPEVAP